MEEEAVLDEFLASVREGEFEDDAEGEAEALEHVGGGDWVAEGVEEEGGGGAFDGVGDWVLRGG